MRKGNRILSGLAAALMACGGASQVEEPGPLNAASPAIVRVENQSYADFNIYVFRNQDRQRLGRSTANTTQSFRIPADLMTGRPRITIGADPIGRQVGAISREISIQPGDTVFLTIPPA